jgi:hypothetical protein
MVEAAVSGPRLHLTGDATTPVSVPSVVGVTSSAKVAENRGAAGRPSRAPVVVMVQGTR